MLCRAVLPSPNIMTTTPINQRNAHIRTETYDFPR